MDRLIATLTFFLPIAAVGTWITWFVKRRQINDVSQSWMREKRIEVVRFRFKLAIILTVAAVLVLAIFLPGQIRASKAAAEAAETALESTTAAG